VVGWTEINFPHQELNPDTVTHPSINRARRRVTLLIWPTSLPTVPNCHQDDDDDDDAGADADAGAGVDVQWNTIHQLISLCPSQPSDVLWLYVTEPQGGCSLVSQVV